LENSHVEQKTCIPIDSAHIPSCPHRSTPGKEIVQSVGSANVTGSEPDALDSVAERSGDRSEINPRVRFPPWSEPPPITMTSDVDEDTLTSVVEGLTLEEAAEF